MDSREERISKLAVTLKASGLAKSDAQARIMAEEMVGVEENVQKKYEEEHSKIHEYLKTAKHLGSVPSEKKVEKTEKKFSDAQNLKNQINLSGVKNSGNTENDENVGQKSNIVIPSGLKEQYKTVDESAHEKVILEPVHTDIPVPSGKSLRDMMLNQIKEDNHEIKTVEQLDEELKNKAFSGPEQVKEPISDTKKSASVLDGQRLAEMMEEDGPLEGHTREIKGKPSVVKPKEEYEENSVDLSEMFNVNKK
ncbi:MAG: hypothetical protein QXK76_04100 [Candidatus Woesearchaeota archaeon]